MQPEGAPPNSNTSRYGTLGHLEYDWELPLFSQQFLFGLAKDHTLIRYDARGNGLSDWDVHELSLDAWVSDMETVADAAGLGRFPLIGFSQGCAVFRLPMLSAIPSGSRIWSCTAATPQT